MIKDMKTFFKLAQYSLGYKTNLIMAIVFAICGLLWEILTIFASDILFLDFEAGAYFLILAGATFAQTAFSVIYVGIGASSIEYRKILMRYSVLFIAVLSLFSTMIAIMIHLIVLVREPESGRNLPFTLLQIGLFSFCIQAYFAIAYKVYAMSSVLFSIVVIPLMFIGTYFDLFSKMSSMPISLAIICCLVFTVLGTCAYYGITRLLYKKPLDPLAFRSAMAKASK